MANRGKIKTGNRLENKKQTLKNLDIEIVEYNGDDREERIEKGLELLVEFLFREYKRRKTQNFLTFEKDDINSSIPTVEAGDILARPKVN